MRDTKVVVLDRNKLGAPGTIPVAELARDVLRVPDKAFGLTIEFLKQRVKEVPPSREQVAQIRTVLTAAEGVAGLRESPGVIATDRVIELARDVLQAPAAATDRTITFLNLCTSVVSPSTAQLALIREVVQAAEQHAALKQRDNFLKKYSVRVLGESQVELKIPVGSSPRSLPKATQALIPKLLPGTVAMQDDVFNELFGATAFRTGLTEALTVRIDGSVKGSLNLSRSAQAQNGWNNVAPACLAIAHQAFLVATHGKDLFCGRVVRDNKAALALNPSSGLRIRRYDGDGAAIKIAASRHLGAVSGRK